MYIFNKRLKLRQQTVGINENWKLVMTQEKDYLLWRCKTCTDIPQSETLSKILPLESADMARIFPIDDWDLIKNGSGNVKFYPAWSLAALLNVLPDELEDNHFLTLSKEGAEYCCCYEDINGNSFKHAFADNPVDACVAMIEKMKK